jgi:hypothetical protein
MSEVGESPLLLVLRAVAGARAGRPVDVDAVRAQLVALVDQVAATAAEAGERPAEWAAFGQACLGVVDVLEAEGPSAAVHALNGALRALAQDPEPTGPGRSKENR